MSAGARIAGKHDVAYATDTGTSIASERYEGMSAEWHKEHEAAFDKAQAEAKGHFNRCPKCRRWVCESDWNEQEGLCVEDAPRESAEVAAARAERRVEEIREEAARTHVFKGKIEARQTICPACGKPAGTGKFCNNCGTPLTLAKCPKCGASNPAGTRFCGECGTKL